MIFNRNEYIEANEIAEVIPFNWTSADNTYIGKINFSLVHNNAHALPRTPYAGFEFDHEPTTEFIESFIIDILKKLKTEQIDQVVINQSPAFYKGIKKLDKVLVSHAFQISHEINHHIPLSKSWQDNISAMQMRRIKKCIKENAEFKEESLAQCEDIHRFIAFCRVQQGLVINIDQERFVKIIHKLPNVYRLFSVRLNNHMVAALVTITVDHEVVYSFLPAFDRSYGEWSPLSFLFFNVCHLLESESKKILDLGISSISGEPQSGLIKFKESLGGIRTLRAKYELNIK